LAGSRLFTRILVVCGILGLVFAWRIDRAVKTAYDSKWVAANTAGLRLPTQAWSWFYAFTGALSGILLLGAALFWRRRERGAFFGDVRASDEPDESELGHTSAVISVVVLALALGTAFARWEAADGMGEVWLTFATALNGAAILGVAGLALLTGNLVYGDLTGIVKGVIRRQRMNLVIVFALAAGLMFIGQTSGQSIDSIRSWAPIVFDGHRPSWSSLGAARLTLGLAAALLLALVVYECAVRLTQAKASLEPPSHGWLKSIFWTGLALCGVGLLGLFGLPLGPGLLLAGFGLLLLRALELPHLSGGKSLVGMEPTQAEVNAPEWIAITPLLALAATSVTATVEAAISGGWDLNAAMTAAPAFVLGALAVLMTRPVGSPTPKIEGVPRSWLLVLMGAIALVSLILLFVNQVWLAALYGLLWLALLTYYAWRLFANRPLVGGGGEGAIRRDDWHAYSVPVALGGGLAAFVGIHARPLDAGHLLGVFTIALLALAFLLPLLRSAVQATLRLRPPRLLWWFGFNQVPILSMLLIWWIAVGVVQMHYGPTKSLHDVRLVVRTPAGLAPTADATPTLERFFEQWVKGQQDRGGPAADGPIPLVLVAAHGGGIRAAYWTVAALDCLVGVSSDAFDPASLESEDETVRENARESTCTSRRRTIAEQQAAARRIFMASGVSGGAVGLYAYARQLLDSGELGSTSDWVNDRLGGDFASPAIGWALFHDVPNRLVGLHPDAGAPCGWKWFGDVCLRQDRAAVLEETFDDKWDESTSAAAQVRRSYDLRFSDDAETRRRASLLPLIVMNATMTGGKARAVISAADLGSWPAADADDPERGDDRLPLAGTVEIRDALCETEDLRLSSAALLAGRFPYVTPSGHIPQHCGYEGQVRSADKTARCANSDTEREVHCEGRFVDGGYIDNSGLFTLVAIWPSLRGLIVDYNVKARAEGRREIAPMIIELDNHYRASLLATVPSGGSSAETLIPPQTAFGGRSSTETYARAAAYRILPSSCTVTISPALHPGLIAPLGWELSETARADLRAALTKPHPEDETGMKAVLLIRQGQSRMRAPTEQKVTTGEPLDRCLPRLPTTAKPAD
jgi:hypothetical protein